MGLLPRAGHRDRLWLIPQSKAKRVVCEPPVPTCGLKNSPRDPPMPLPSETYGGWGAPRRGSSLTRSEQASKLFVTRSFSLGVRWTMLSTIFHLSSKICLQ